MGIRVDRIERVDQQRQDLGIAPLSMLLNVGTFLVQRVQLAGESTDPDEVRDGGRRNDEVPRRQKCDEATIAGHDQLDRLAEALTERDQQSTLTQHPLTSSQQARNRRPQAVSLLPLRRAVTGGRDIARNLKQLAVE